MSDPLQIFLFQSQVSGLYTHWTNFQNRTGFIRAIQVFAPYDLL